MKRAFFIFALLTHLFGADIEKLKIELVNLTNEQEEILLSTFNKGKKFGYEFTLTAIAWEESKFGKHMINLSDPSCGVFHVMPKSALRRNNLKVSKWNLSRMCEQLIDDFDFSFSSALLELKYWENYWKQKKVKKVWSKTVMSYNAGFSYKNGSKYLQRIREKIIALRWYFKTIHKTEEQDAKN